jgi:S1-C subfamily serine protease
MQRVLIVATLLLASSQAESGQTLGVLHIRIVVADAGGNAIPVPRHVLLISDNPATAVPRQVTTALDGTADVRLRAGNYTVESDRPVVFHGKAYQWTQTVDIVAGRDAVLELTADNADTDPAAPGTDSGPPLEADPWHVLPQWQDSVVALWTPLAHASGFVIDARGLIATNQRAVGTAASVEVQLSPSVKVAGRIVAADAARDVAIVRIDPGVAASVRPVPLPCAEATKPPLAVGQKLFTIGVPLREEKGITSATVSRVEGGAIISDFILPSGSAGGPVFTDAGTVVGITSIADEGNESRRDAARIIRIEDACDVLATAEKKMKEVMAPDRAPLPVEPMRPFPVAALKDAVQSRAGTLNPYQISSADFDVAFITPLLVYGSQYPPEPARERDSRAGAHTADAGMTIRRPLTDFGNWSEYVADVPPVLLIRVTPRAVEGFWTTVARGAARTQGVALPPIKRVKAGFSRMRAFCGETEVTPVHPFKIEQRVAENATIYEGLYVFAPDALGLDCGSVTLMLYSDKEPEKSDTRVVDAGVLQQIRRDFALYREP